MRISTSMLNGNAVSAILQDQSNLSNTQQQLASGLKINNPSDNPVGAAQLLALNNISSQDTQYTTNGQAANTNLTLEQTALSSSTSTLQSIRDLVLQANSGTNTPSDLKAIGTQIQTLEQQLMSTANTKNDAGQYLFSGYMQSTQPFVRGGSGSVTYAGDSGTSTIALDSGTPAAPTNSATMVPSRAPRPSGRKKATPPITAATVWIPTAASSDTSVPGATACTSTQSGTAAASHETAAPGTRASIARSERRNGALRDPDTRAASRDTTPRPDTSTCDTPQMVTSTPRAPSEHTTVATAMICEAWAPSTGSIRLPCPTAGRSITHGTHSMDPQNPTNVATASSTTARPAQTPCLPNTHTHWPAAPAPDPR